MKLTDRVIAAMQKKPAGKWQEHRDDDEPGLSLKVSPKGVCSWSLRYLTAAAEHRRKTLGRYPDIGLARARHLARAAKGQVAEKVDIVGAERARKAEAERQKAHQLDALAEDYFRDAAAGRHRAGSKVRPKAPAALAEERRVYAGDVKPAFGTRPVEQITRREVVAFLAKVGRRAPSAGRHAYTLLRQLMSYAVSRDLLDANPLLGLAVTQAQPRDRVPTDPELRQLWAAFAAPEAVDGLALSEPMGLALKMAMVTMQRAGEVIGMRWAEIDREARLWTIPASRMKGKRVHLVPLSDLALSLLDQAAELGGDLPLVFASPRSDETMDRRALSRAMQRTVKALDLDRLTAHDFRRAGSSRLTGEAVGTPRFVVGQVLAHADHGVTGIYDRNDYLAEKRRALTAWASLLGEIVGKPSNNVVPIRSGAA